MAACCGAMLDSCCISSVWAAERLHVKIVPERHSGMTRLKIWRSTTSGPCTVQTFFAVTQCYTNLTSGFQLVLASESWAVKS